MIPTSKRVEYALGFVGLGMLDEASDELEAVAFTDRFLPEVLLARIELHMAAKHWETVVGLGRELVFLKSSDARGWIAWAYSLRELGQVVQARAALLAAMPEHGETCAILHYNLACYAALLGEIGEAKLRLQRACRMNGKLKDRALDDHDLEPLWNSIGLMM